RALPSVSGGAIRGAAARFRAAGGFSPALIAGVGRSCPVAFDDNGATQDSTYNAPLPFTSADEPLPGAMSQPDLAVALRARVTGGVVMVGDHVAPAQTRLLAPSPNPLTRASTLRFDLARAGRV